MLAWADLQNEYTESHLARTDTRAALRQRLTRTVELPAAERARSVRRYVVLVEERRPAVGPGRDLPRDSLPAEGTVLIGPNALSGLTAPYRSGSAVAFARW